MSGFFSVPANKTDTFSKRILKKSPIHFFAVLVVDSSARCLYFLPSGIPDEIPNPLRRQPFKHDSRFKHDSSLFLVSHSAGNLMLQFSWSSQLDLL